MAKAKGFLAGALVGWLGRLRFPVLFVITAALLVVDLVLPDPFPLVDEILLGLATATLASWRRRGEGDEEEEKLEPGDGAG